MILVTLGTQDKQFKRLLEMIDKEINEGNIKDEVIVQAGCTKYNSKHMKMFDLIPIEEFEKLISECDILITHAGVGSILSGINKGKKIIVAPRLKKYKEHVNDHQVQITNDFYDLGYILKIDENETLYDNLKKIKTFIPKKYVFNTDNFIKKIEKDIENLLNNNVTSKI